MMCGAPWSRDEVETRLGIQGLSNDYRASGVWSTVQGLRFKGWGLELRVRDEVETRALTPKP